MRITRKLTDMCDLLLQEIKRTRRQLHTYRLSSKPRTKVQRKKFTATRHAQQIPTTSSLCSTL